MLIFSALPLNMPSPERVTQLNRPQTQTERIRRFSTPSWEDTRGMIEIRTNRIPRLHSLYENNLDLLRSYYDAVYLAVISGEKLTKPDAKDPIDGPKNRTFSTHFRIIRETVSQTTEQRRSKGWKKHVRDQKAAIRRG